MATYPAPVAGRVVPIPRRGWNPLRCTLVEPGLMSTLLLAALLTPVVVGGVNFLLWHRLEATYIDVPLADLTVAAGNQAVVDRVDRVTANGWADESIRGNLEKVLTSASGVECSRQLLAQIFRDAKEGTGAAGREQAVLDRFRDLLIGAPKPSVPWGMVEVPRLTGAQIVDQLKAHDDRLLVRVLADIDQGQSLERFLVRLVDQSARSVQRSSSYQWMARINGPVQWVTVAVALWVTFLLIRRSWLLLRLRDREPDERYVQVMPWLGDAARTALARPDLVKVELDRVERHCHDDFYATVGLLVGLLPSLGFIGTVVGMGQALLEADGLFTATDKQVTVVQITRSLGVAFDTTLVALMLSIAVGLLVMAVRVQESAMFRSLVRAWTDHAVDRGTRHG